MKGCFVCPIYDKGTDFDFGYQMVDSVKESVLVHELFFVFSSDEQKNKFLQECKIRYGVNPNGLVLNKDLSTCKNPVTIKKFFGIDQLKDKYNYISTIDCECIFTKEFEVGHLLDEIWNEKSFLAANIATKGAAIVKTCAEALGLENNTILLKETDNFKYAWWFNEIPVYRMEDIQQFWNWLEENERMNIIYNEWCCFDYILYVIWLIIEKGMHLNKFQFKNSVSVVESLWIPEIRKKVEIEKELGTHWTSRVNLESTINTRICIQFHRDRRHMRFRQYFWRFYRKYLKR